MAWQFWIDRGGTFTDIVARAPDGALHTAKLLSENPECYRDAATAGIRRMLGLAVEASIPHGTIERVCMGTTVATNALLERKGEPVLLLITAGFGDLLTMGHMTRPRLFDLDVRLPGAVHAAVEEISGRVAADGTVLSPLDEPGLRATLARHRAAGLKACAIALIHGWRYPEMEARLATLAVEAGFAQVTTSHAASKAMGLVARGRTAVVDAYLSPVLHHYVQQVERDLGEVPLYFMRSDGGLSASGAFHGRDAILSGPAGGIVGAARTAEAAGLARIVAFDMGGTSTDIAIHDGGFEHRYDAVVGGVDIRAPMMAIDTIAAGGGSILHYDGTRMQVGPESAGANPGPASYRRGGPLTMTDANLMCGKIAPDHFPAIFGPHGDQPLDHAGVAERFGALADRIGDGRRGVEVAEGFIAIGVSAMAAAIKRLALARGADVRDHALQCYGGAGGQHACLVAADLGMTRVLVHPLAGVMSAYGMGLAARSAVRSAMLEQPLDAVGGVLAATVDELSRDARAEAGAEAETAITVRLRQAGSDTALGVPLGDAATMRAAFLAQHRARFGFAEEASGLILAEVIVEATLPPPEPAKMSAPPPGATPSPIGTTRMRSGGQEHLAPVWNRATLPRGFVLPGPAMICEDLSTTIVEAGWTAQVLPGAELMMTGGARADEPIAKPHADRVDPVLLELYSARFMALAEQMGEVLRNTATSVNMKERLDFSCALFDSEGQLIANAPHVPVHLGAMGQSVRTVLEARGASDLLPGDAFVLNNPYNGGTHLPDITVISPVFAADDPACLLGFVANRGHHADIGGTTPGSTPPHARTLAEEGVVLDNLLLLRGGVFREAAIRAALADAPWPARNPDANLADLRAQVAANAAGVREFLALVARHGRQQVLRYMAHVLDHGETVVRQALAGLGSGHFATTLDDGRALAVTVRIHAGSGTAQIDFTGTGPQDHGNFNAPTAVTRAVVLYALRALVGHDMPLNDGCLRPVKLIIPNGCFLAPSPGRAVVAGNTEISQQVVNAVLAAFGASAAAQGTMNNFLFGNERVQYYETIGGGMGAGPGFAGAGPVQCHMTNTRITDPEVLEWRLPVRLERFAIRRGSGGAGQWRGGDGAIRAVRALKPMVATLVSSSRHVAPFGACGGGNGAPGRQWVARADGKRESLSGRAEVSLMPGDMIVIETPGGGGWGENQA